jgi:hypothetical protein
MRRRIARLVAPLAQEIARAVVDEQQRRWPPRIVLNPKPLSPGELEALREQITRHYR